MMGGYLRRRLWYSDRLGGFHVFVTNLKRSIDDGTIDEYPGRCMFLWMLEDYLDYAAVLAMHSRFLLLEGKITGLGPGSPCW